MHELIFDVPRFLAKHKILGYLSEEEGESLHCLVNKQLQQYQNVRDQSEKLRLIVTNEELLSTADRSLAHVTPRPKCDPCNVFLRMGTCPQCKKAVNNPLKFSRFKNKDHKTNNNDFYCNYFLSFVGLRKKLLSPHKYSKSFNYFYSKSSI